MKLTEAVEKALEQRVDAITQELRDLKDERAELLEALGKDTRPAGPITRSRPAPNRDAIEQVIINHKDGLTPYEAADLAEVNRRSSHGALKALAEKGTVKEVNGRWFPADAEVTEVDLQPTGELPPEKRGGFNPEWDVPEDLDNAGDLEPGQ